MTANHRTQPKTLGLLGTSLVTVMQNQMWQGAIHAAQAHGARLIFYPVVNLGTFLPFPPSSQVLLKMVGGDPLDGLLVWYAGVTEGITAIQGRDIFDLIGGLPIVTIGGRVSPYPDLSIDNYQGARASVEHLIRDHNRQHFGLIRGPVGHPDADERFRGCLETLEAHNLSVPADRVSETLFALGRAADAAYECVTRWLTEPGRKLDAVVTASDYMALAAIKAVQALGLRVPDDVAVIGFDDVSQAQVNIPSLTTVRQPFYDMGRQGVEMLLASIDGHALPSRSLIPSSLVVRESCGCVPHLLVTATDGMAPSSSPLSIASPVKRLNDELSSLSHDPNFPVQQIQELATHLEGQIDSDAVRRFLSSLRHLLVHAITTDFDATAWQGAMTALRSYAFSHTQGDHRVLAEILFNQARILVTEALQRVHIRQRLEAQEQIDNLRSTSEALIGSFGKPLMLNTISEYLPALGFTGIYLSLYDDPDHPERTSTLILAYHNGRQADLPPEGIRFSTPKLFPPHFLPSNPTVPLVVEPLFFSSHPLGLLVLEVGPSEGPIYETMRAEISSALQGSLLLQQVHDHAAQLEQHVADRTDDLETAIAQLQQEITGRQKAQEALARERNLLRTLVDSMPDLIFAKDIEGRFILKNEVDARMMGAESPDETIGKTDFDYYPADVAARFKADDDLVLHQGESLVNREELTVDAEGHEHWFLTTKVPLRDPQGQVLGLVGMAHDITRRKQAEDALRTSEEVAREFQGKLKTLQEISLELVSTESLEQFCLKAIELGHSALGYDRLGLLLFEDESQTKASRFGIESDGHLHAEYGTKYPSPNDGLGLTHVLTDRKSVYINEDAVLGDFDHAVGHGWNVITGIWDGNTSIGWLAADNYFTRQPLIPYQVELLNLYGLTIGHLVTRKRAEAEIRRLNSELEQRVIERTAELQAAHDRLQVLSRAKDEFVSNVSHELRTPITNIKLYHDLLDKRPEKFNHYTGVLRREINRLESLVEALLTLSRLDQNREKISMVRSDLKGMLRQFVSDREALAAAKNITLTLELGPEPLMVDADQRLFEQVLSILLTNAFAYTPPGGSVTVRTLERVVEGERWTGFSVSDTGLGIAPDEQKRLFERFFRGQAGRDSNAPGTGLGLSIAQEIVERHKGRIEVFSEGIGHGTVFSVWLTNQQSARPKEGKPS